MLEKIFTAKDAKNAKHAKRIKDSYKHFNHLLASWRFDILLIRQAFSGAAVLMVVALSLAACEDKVKPSVLSSVDSATLPQQESWNSQITISDSGKIRAVIDAGYLQVFESSRKTFLSEGVKVQFYEMDGTPGSVLTSASGTVDENTNNLEARGNVVVVSTERTKLYTEQLFWTNARELIHTPAFVRIVSPEERLQGYGLESDQSLKNYRIFSVTGESKAR